MASAALLLAVTGCGGKEPPPKKVVKIGPENAAGQAAPANPPGIVASPARHAESAKAAAQSRRKKKTKDVSNRSGEDVELGYGEQLYAVLPDSAPSGIPYVIDDAGNPNRFAFVPGDRGVDSTQFAVSKGGGAGGTAAPAGSESEGHLKDESTTTYELPGGFTAIASAGYSASGLPWRIRCDEDGAVMALVPEGVFTQGTNSGSPNAAPEHGAFLDAFYIDMREVTYARYEKFRDSMTDKRRVPKPARAAKDRHEPVLGVTWAEAHAFAVWAEKDLPTEAQWEKAARGPDGFKFPWGNGPFIWHRSREPAQIDPVGSFRGDTSPYGVFDMAGNAREWCSDWYVDKYYSQLVAEVGSTARNPTGPRSSAGSNQRVVKGGDPNWYVWARTGVHQNEHPNDVGFRCVLKLKPPGKDKKKSAK
jgi:formylglycine-generating enzyme required for sulfatase activity